MKYHLCKEQFYLVKDEILPFAKEELSVFDRISETGRLITIERTITNVSASEIIFFIFCSPLNYILYFA